MFGSICPSLCLSVSVTTLIAETQNQYNIQSDVPNPTVDNPYI